MASLAVLGIVLVACSSGTHRSSVKVKPEQILQAPAGLIDGTSPQPNGTMWLLAGPQSARTIRELVLPSGQLGVPVPTSSDAVSLSQSSTGVLAVGVSTSHTGAVMLCSGATGIAYATIPLAGPVRSVTFGDDGTTLFALVGTAPVFSVAVVATTTREVRTYLPAPSNSIAALPLPNESGVYVLGSDGSLDEVSNPAGRLIFSFSVGTGALGLALSPEGTTIYVLKEVGGNGVRNVAMINAVTETTAKVLPTPANTVAIAVSPDGSRLYALVGTPSIGNVQAFSLAG